MPAALDVNWEAVRTLAIVVGVREAARQMGIDENSTLARSAREGWIKAIPRGDPLPISMTPTPAIGAIKAPNALQNYNQETRVNHAIASHKLSVKVAGMDADDLFQTVPNVLAAAKHAAVTHGWAGAQVQVGIRLDELAKGAAIAVEMPIIED